MQELPAHDAQAAPAGPASASGAAAIRRRRIGLALLGLCVLAIALSYAWWETRRDRIRTITEGRVYQSGEFAPDQLRAEVQRLGIRTVIDLREPPEDAQRERDALSGTGARFVHLPSSRVPDQATVDRFLEIMRDPTVYPVLIHCKHGTGRSVLLSAIYRIEFEGWDRERARLATRSTLRWMLPGASFAVDAPKGKYLLDYVKRGQTGAVAPAADGQASHSPDSPAAATPSAR